MKSKVSIERPRKKRSRKSGMAPGSLLLIGEVKTQKTSLQLIDYGPKGVIEKELDSFEELRTYQRQHQILWVNLYGLQNIELLQAVCEFFGLHPLAIEDVLNTDQRPKIDDYGDLLYIDMHLHRLDKLNMIYSDQISMALGKDFVLSVQERPSGTLEPVRQRLRAGHSLLRDHGSDFLVYSLLDAIVDSHFAIVERLDEECDRLEDEILEGTPAETQKQLHQIKRETAKLRRHFWPLRELLSTLQHSANPLLGKETQPYLRDVLDHVIHLAESLEDLREIIVSLQEVYFSKISHRLNLELRALTVVTTTFMPAALIAGIFGMNFKSMPWIEDSAGFGLAMGLMVTIALVMLIAFWRRRMV